MGVFSRCLHFCIPRTARFASESVGTEPSDIGSGVSSDSDVCLTSSIRSGWRLGDFGLRRPLKNLPSATCACSLAPQQSPALILDELLTPRWPPIEAHRSLEGFEQTSHATLFVESFQFRHAFRQVGIDADLLLFALTCRRLRGILPYGGAVFLKNSQRIPQPFTRAVSAALSLPGFCTGRPSGEVVLRPAAWCVLLRRWHRRTPAPTLRGMRSYTGSIVCAASTMVLATSSARLIGESVLNPRRHSVCCFDHGTGELPRGLTCVSYVAWVRLKVVSESVNGFVVAGTARS